MRDKDLRKDFYGGGGFKPIKNIQVPIFRSDLIKQRLSMRADGSFCWYFKHDALNTATSTLYILSTDFKETDRNRKHRKVVAYHL